MAPTHKKTAEFRFYEELNDFLSADKQKTPIAYQFSGTPSIKDAVEAIGVPHTEIELILINGESVGFDRHLKDGDKVSVYPVFESFDVSDAIRLREAPLRHTKFVLDVHLGKLAKLLRMFGFDTVYCADNSDTEIVGISLTEKRIILTRDKELLKNSAITHGYWIRACEPENQIREVIERFDLSAEASPFQRCMACNDLLEDVDKKDVLADLPEESARYYNDFRRCVGCQKVYWKGSHFESMKKCVQDILGWDNLDP